MKLKYLVPFTECTVNVLKTMTQTEVTHSPAIKQSGNLTTGAVTSIISLVGDNCRGSLILTFDKPAALGIVSRLLMENFTEINKDIVDAIGEVTNIISGNSKPLLAELGFKVGLAIPITIVGSGVEVREMCDSRYVIPFKTKEGSFQVECGLESTDKSFE